MKTKLIFASIIFSLIGLTSQAQSYFQQKVDNKIEVTLDDNSHLLRAHITINYTNNSSDSLAFIYFHLWPNAYSSDRTANNKQEVENGNKKFYFADKEDWGFMDSLHFSVDGIDANIEPTTDKDIIKLKLNQPLLPGQTITIETPFKVQIPETFSRLGHYGESYQISQWFPKPAVYDHKGWHPMPYLNQGEFYSEFGSYDVSITLPENYVVMATGNLQNESEQTWLLTLADKKIEDYSKEKEIPSATKTKTIRYKEDNVHDFAWFADKRWVVRKAKTKLPNSNKEIEIFTAFLPEHKNGWEKSTDYVAETLIGYSEKVGNYPYKTAKAVEGRLTAGGGMEYPTVTIIIPSNEPSIVREVIIHEVGHNWFYGILANNERIHPWMDESLNSFYEFKQENKLFDLSKGIQKYFANHLRKTFQSQAISSPATDFTSANYGLDVYDMGPKYLEWLEAYLGKDTFQKAMHNYYQTFQFKHVYPEDLQKSMEASTGKDLNWFFEGVMKSNYPIDFSIQKIKTESNTSKIVIKNHSPIAAPAIVEIQNQKEPSHHLKLKTKPFVGTTTLEVKNDGEKYDYGFINPVVPDHISSNNEYSNGKNFHLGIKPIAHLVNDEVTNIDIAPALGYNHYDGFMLGLLFHNISIPYPNFMFGIAPMYGFKSRNIVGTGFLSYTQYTPTNNHLHHIQYKLEGKSFGLETSNLNISKNISSRFIKIAPEVIFALKKPYPRSPLERNLSVKAYYISEQDMNFSMNPIDSAYYPSLGDYQNQVYGKIKYSHFNHRTFNPYAFILEGQAGEHFAKISATAHLKIDYHLFDKALYLRAFVGKFIGFGANDMFYNRYQLSAAYSGWNDYLYDQTFMSRNENTGLGAHQILIQEGGMKINTLKYANQLGLSSNWMFAFNLKSDIPIRTKIPVQIFADFTSFSGASHSNPSGAKFLWDAGIQIGSSDNFAIYIPLIYSQDYKDYLKSVYGKNVFWNSINFSFNLNAIDWSRPIENSGLLRLLR